jgi:hypothetical protein
MVCAGALQPCRSRTDEPRDQGHPAKGLTAQAGDPTAPLLQMQVTNFYAPENYNADGYSNQFNFQPVIPVPRSERMPISQVMRVTVPLVTTPGPDRTTGLGDISYFDLFVPKGRDWGIWGVGFSTVLPTASDDALGQGKWQLGPAATFVYYKVSNWQLGTVLQNPISIAGDDDRPGVNEFQFQPLINYLKGKWYFGTGDYNWIFDWKQGGEATIPLAFQTGRITKIGKHNYNLSVELGWTAVRPDDAVVPRWGIRLGVVLLLPERAAAH